MSTSTPPEQKTTTVHYTPGQVEAAIVILTDALDRAKIPMPMAILAMESILDRIRESGVVFQRGPRIIPQ